MVALEATSREEAAMAKGDQLLRAHALLTSLAGNLPEGFEVEERWVQEYHNALGMLETATSSDLTEFKVASTDRYRSVATRNTLSGEVTYRDGLYCRREVLLAKIDASLRYFTGVQTGQDRQIGYRR